MRGDEITLEMKINEVAKLTGITVRTLHYYDEIGLLKPSRITNSGYRLYNKEALEKLQQILFFRELDFSLKDIKEIMLSSSYSKEEALKKHRELLIQKENRLKSLIELIEQIIEGDNSMSFKEFDNSELIENKKKYAKEVKERYGHTDAYKESEQKTAGYDNEKWKTIQADGDKILEKFAEYRNLSPDSREVQELVKKWQDYITDNFYKCTNEILSGLGVMYIKDERFTKNIDKNGEGTAQFMSKAIEIYCS